MPVTSELGSSRGMQEPMDESVPVGQESIDNRLIEDIYQKFLVSLGEGTATCHVCGFPFCEGDAGVVYVFRPSESDGYQVGHVVCGDGRHSQVETFTVGVRELLVEDRIKWCSDEASQSSRPVLVAPDVVGVSVAATESIRRVPDDGSTTASVVSNVEDRGGSESPVKVSVAEARHRTDGTNGDVVPELFWSGR